MLEFITTFFAINSLINQDPKVEIRGVESKMWLCMNRKGDLYATVSYYYYLYSKQLSSKLDVILLFFANNFLLY